MCRRSVALLLLAAWALGGADLTRWVQWAEAAVILRAPRAGRPVRSGIAIMLAHDFHTLVTDLVTGAVAGVLKPRSALPESFEKWHEVDIVLDGARLRVTIDGVVMQDADPGRHPELRQRLKTGFVGFPDMGYAYAMRNVRIEDVGNRTKFVKPFDGRSLEGWDLRGGGDWTAKDGVIEGKNGHGILYAPGEFKDFELTVLVRSHERVNSGVFLPGSRKAGPVDSHKENASVEFRDILVRPL